ncbi:MAG: prephenate dehydrogenase [Coriobacteriia bacterium]|nr:prephenate dehydrogenase [Coriobacteriia bacterium]MCL2745534.1 prephenate dehydrogenase [Coriobacteriia bacterium]MCL2870840.1 prephenate dehydrogenase [Coriobacteriia bacterium]
MDETTLNLDKPTFADDKTVGIVGLGLIGGSLAKALKVNTANRVLGYDINPNVVKQALAEDVLDATLALSETNGLQSGAPSAQLHECDMILIALYPEATIDFVRANWDKFKKGTVIIDCAGVKAEICAELSAQAAERDLYFVGGHPMTGIERTGYEHSFAHLFSGGTMILCRDEHTNIIALKAAEMLFTGIGFLKITITSAEEHDRVIAFTSQLPHVVAGAFIRSETVKQQLGFSAGSYQDLTRVAFLNEPMWTELFMANRQNLIAEIEGLRTRLEEYVQILEEGDEQKMLALLAEGKQAKQHYG